MAAAYYAAGRAVASALRGWVDGCVDIAAPAPRPGVPAQAVPFVDYAGIWARARRCGDLAGESGVSDDRLAEAMVAHPGDASAVGQAQFEIATTLRACGLDDAWGWLPGVAAAWRAELEQMWPVVQHVAVLLVAGRRVPAERVRRLAQDRLAGGLAI